MFKNKLVFKITLGYTLITLISLLIVGLFFINMFREYSFQNKENSMINRAREIAKVSAPYLSE
jgi:two-component system sensor histidine kinase ResE